MKRVGLLGWPVAHSVSPAMHNAAFEALGMNGWQYDLQPVRDEADLEAHIAGLIGEGYRGFNVTVPYKEVVLELSLIQEVSEGVQAIGAANTLIAVDGGLRAENTDWRGFMDDLNTYDIVVRNRACTILGTGGSSKAVAYALRERGAGSITFVSRSKSKHADVRGYNALAQVPRGSLIVNCTPVGMYPQVTKSPWPETVAFPDGAVLYDLVYNPPETRLMQQAKTVGARAYGGLGMLVGQAALSFRLWTGRPAPPVMAAAARHALGIAEDAGI